MDRLLSHLSKYHLWTGLVFFVVFVLTGQYMDIYLNHLFNMEAGPRMIYRSGHIYILFGSLLNILSGFTNYSLESQLKCWMTLIGSVSIMLTPICFTYGFIMEAPIHSLNREITSLGIYFALLGCSLIMLAQRILPYLLRYRIPNNNTQ